MIKKQDNRLIVFGLGAIVILLIIVVCMKINNMEPEYSELTEEELDVEIEEQIDEMKIRTLSELEEGNRIEYYAKDFIEKIDNGQYEAAYELLYDDFKLNYFPTLESFKQYSEENFPKLMSLEHTNLERNGNIYVLWTTIYDLMQTRVCGKVINILFKENAINDYEISFSLNGKEE